MQKAGKKISDQVKQVCMLGVVGTSEEKSSSPARFKTGDCEC
jgi:hypothetical protein